MSEQSNEELFEKRVKPLRDIHAALAALTKDSIDVDEQLALYHGWDVVIGIGPKWYRSPETKSWMLSPPNYTGSVDVAMQLIPSNVAWESSHEKFPLPLYSVWMQVDDSTIEAEAAHALLPVAICMCAVLLQIEVIAAEMGIEYDVEEDDFEE